MKSFLVADALDLVSDLQRTVVFAKCKPFQFRSKPTNQGAQIALVVRMSPMVTMPAWFNTCSVTLPTP
jgi:hypothetical protein